MRPESCRQFWIALCYGLVFGNLTPAFATPSPEPLALSRVDSFETLERLGFSPDGITYRMATDTLLIVSAAGEASPRTGIFEVTTEGALIQQSPLPTNPTGLGFAITNVDQENKSGHLFLPEFNNSPTIRVTELDESFAEITTFDVVGSTWPGDGIAYNPIDDRLAILDAGACRIFEVELDGAPTRSFPIPCASGLTFNRETGTYFAVDFHELFELSLDGALLRRFDLTAFGIEQAVGIGAGGGRLFVADEIDGPNSGGRITILKLVGKDECAATATAICLNEERFRVEITCRSRKPRPPLVSSRCENSVSALIDGRPQYRRRSCHRRATRDRGQPRVSWQVLRRDGPMERTDRSRDGAGIAQGRSRRPRPLFRAGSHQGECDRSH